MEIISSLENQKVKSWNKLNEKKYRDSTDLFLIEGDHLVNEAYKKNMLVELIALPTFTCNYDININYVTDEIMKKISRMESISPVIGVCKKFKPLNYGNRLLLLDKLQDPGNLGTIIRSAVAFNIDTIILGNGCVDLYNDKTIRASEGMIFNIDIISKELNNFIDELHTNNYVIYGTDVKDGTILSNIDFKEKFAIVIGNEGNGLSESLKHQVDKNIYIPMNKECESLNASVATSIIMYEMSKSDYE